jgi:hypothetical protein
MHGRVGRVPHAPQQLPLRPLRGAREGARREHGKAGDGNYLATMFTFRTPKWSEWNEIDIELEANIKGRVAYNMVNALNALGYPGGDAGSMVPPGTTSFTIQQFHVYSFEWGSAKVTWYVDGVKLRDNAPTRPSRRTRRRS